MWPNALTPRTLVKISFQGGGNCFEYTVHSSFLNRIILRQLPLCSALCCVACGQCGGCLAQFLLEQLSHPQEFDPAPSLKKSWECQVGAVSAITKICAAAANPPFPFPESLSLSLSLALSCSTELALEQQLLLFLLLAISLRTEIYRCRKCNTGIFHVLVLICLPWALLLPKDYASYCIILMNCIYMFMPLPSFCISL